jgi:Alpha/beta hydrolase domain
LDVPLASYGSHSTPAVDSEIARSVCAQTGSVRDLNQAQLRQSYKDRNGYLKRFNEAVDNAVDGRRLLAEDVPALKNPAVRKLPAF